MIRWASQTVNRHLFSVCGVLSNRLNTENQSGVPVCSDNSCGSLCALQATGRETQEGVEQWKKTRLELPGSHIRSINRKILSCRTVSRLHRHRPGQARQDLPCAVGMVGLQEAQLKPSGLPLSLLLKGCTLSSHVGMKRGAGGAP